MHNCSEFYVFLIELSRLSKPYLYMGAKILIKLINHMPNLGVRFFEIYSSLEIYSHH